MNSDQHREANEEIRRQCVRAGEFGHWGCGVCEHDLLYERCAPCTRARVESHKSDPSRSYQRLPPEQYSNGRIAEEEVGQESKIELRVAADKAHDAVIIDFGRSMTWIGLQRKDALVLAEMILKTAAELLP